MTTATIKNSLHQHDVSLEVNGNRKTLLIPAKSVGQGSSVTGGELLFLSLATCFCNDLYREAARKNITIDSVEVTVSGEFKKEGEPGSDIRYTVDVRSDAPEKEIADLIAYVDTVLEIHNTLRKGVAVRLLPKE
ncbi:MAG TPA: OsmC family protein [Chitinophagaceae bacterium]|nr:OsmC family protein [Chitinophagaceae bacterium]